MSPLKTLASILVLFITLGVLAAVFPKNGISVFNVTLRFPSLASLFPEKQDTPQEPAEDPEKAIQRMLEETRQREFSVYADSVKFYESFFKKGATRFDLPNNDPTWFDRFFLHLELASLEDKVVHILHYGDSQIEEDRISGTIRENLQEIFGGSGPGMLPPILEVPSMTTSHWNSGDLERFILFGLKEQEASHNRYGPLAQLANLNGSASIHIKKRPNREKQFPHVGEYSQIRVLTSANSQISISLSYDSTYIENEGDPEKEKKKKRSVMAPNPKVENFEKLRVYQWLLPQPTDVARLNLSGSGEIYGISLDGNHGVALDNVPMRGSSGTIFHRIDKDLLQESYDALNARLIIMEYGGNLVPGTHKGNVEWTKKIITRQIQTIQKVNPNADILFIGPADMAKQINGQLQTYPGLSLVIKALREVCEENGVAYWDMHRVMGGNGSMQKWVKRTPALGHTDYIHFTRQGASHIGNLFSSSLKTYYDFFKFRDAHKIDDDKLNDIRAFVDSLKTKTPDSTIKSSMTIQGEQ